MKRLFAAIKIAPDENFVSIYYRLITELQADKINWVKPENMHLTMKFFGETPEDKMDSIGEVMKEVAANYAPFIISIKNIGIFGSSYQPKVIWFGIDKDTELKKMAKELLEKLDKKGFLSDRQNFVPHLTVGRIKAVQNKKKFQTVIDQFKYLAIQETSADKLILFESILKPAGPVYQVINEFGLKVAGN